MRTTTKQRNEILSRLTDAGISYADACTLRRISMTLSRWGELECGDGNDDGSWAIERDVDTYAVCTQCGEKWYGDTALADPCPKCGDMAPVRHKATDKPYMVHHRWGHGQGKDTITRRPIADREKGALKRLAAIMAQYPELSAYHQGDPRGAAVYILRPGDVPEGKEPDAYYSNGIAVY